MLNYGYAVIRASLAHANVATALLPSLGIHHRSRSNSFCLADDHLEPLRPLVDDKVRDIHRQVSVELDQLAKAELLEILSQAMQLGDQNGPWMLMLARCMASLVRCYAGDSKKLEIPTPARP
ncbi:CRISPR-associated endonuclease Cas1 [Bythopirellula goksoeyrii]|uniref:CRISPR-associated endonuclease Cas1 n=1 Tax=Bythopirellula goksoeyrii TaxID=1400387 RepID=A0A5B9QAI9_9BACT|nr:CRISPR-associated endonuclease Cas1 [Bythopirellula goksoeyrii]